MHVPGRVPSAAARAVLAAVVVALLPAVVAGQPPTVVGLSRGGGSALEYIGIIQQTGPQFAAIGYLTHVRGLVPGALFSGPASEATAKFTFSATAGIANHAQVGSTVSIGAPGQLSIYYNPAGGADFNVPASFTQGTLIAVINVRFFNVLSVIAPDLGVAAGSAHGWQGTAAAFALDGQTYRIGSPGITHHLDLFGKGVRTQPSPPVSTTEFAASSVTTREAPPPPTLSPAVVTGNQVTLSWQPAPDGPPPTSYTLVAAVTPGGPPVATLPLAGLTLSVPAPRGTFYVRVRAHNDFGSSEFSNEVTVVVP
jgi:hypothetical protein